MPLEKNTEWVFMTPHYSYAWTHDRKILSTRLTGADRDTVDAWLEHGLETRTKWEDDDPMLILLDQRGSGMLNTPYFRQTIPKVLQTRSEIMTYSAFILDRSFTARVIETSLRMIPDTKTLVPRVFYEPEIAVEWLLQHK